MNGLMLGAVLKNSKWSFIIENNLVVWAGKNEAKNKFHKWKWWSYKYDEQ